MLDQSGRDVLAGLLLVGGRDGVLEVEKDVIRGALERLQKQRRLRAGDRELAALEPRARRLVAREAHARTAARGGGGDDCFAPGAGGASGVGVAPARGGSGAAVLR